MGWSNYLINKDKTVALEIGKTSYNDINEGTWESLEALTFYMNETEDRKIDVINYLWDRVSMNNVIEGMISIFIEWYEEGDWEIINEEEISKHPKVIIIRRR